MMKNRTSVSKFEEFLKNKYHKEIFDIFEKKELFRKLKRGILNIVIRGG